MAGNLQSGRVVHIDGVLSQMAINYRPSGWIADQVFPMVNVQKQSDIYIIHEQSDLFRREDSRRSRGTEAKLITMRTTSDKYYADNYALKADVTLEDRINRDAAFISDMEQGRVRRVLDKLMIDWELRVSSLAFNTASVGSSANVGSSWTDYTNSNPLTDLWTAMDNVHNATGYPVNRVLFGKRAWDYFRRNTAVRNQAVNPPGGPNVSGAGRLPTQQQIADMLEVEAVLVGRAFHNSGQEGIAQTLTPIWGEHVLLYNAPMTPSTEEPSFGYSFRWAAPGLPNMQVERHPFDTKTKKDEVEVGYYQDEKVTASALAFLVANVGSSQ